MEQGKQAGPWNAQALLEAARKAAADVSANIDEFERLQGAALVKRRDEIERLVEALVEHFLLDPPPGMPHEPAVIEFRNWTRTGLSGFMDEWESILGSIPNEGFKRLITVATKLNEVALQQRYLSSSGGKSASTRWQRLEPVKEWAIGQRATNRNMSRAALIRSIAPQVREMTRQAGEPLTGDDQAVIETITRWFRTAGID